MGDAVSDIVEDPAKILEVKPEYIVIVVVVILLVVFCSCCCCRKKGTKTQNDKNKPKHQEPKRRSLDIEEGLIEERDGVIFVNMDESNIPGGIELAEFSKMSRYDQPGRSQFESRTSAARSQLESRTSASPRTPGGATRSSAPMDDFSTMPHER